MRFTFVFLSAVCLMLASSCSDDSGPNNPADQQVTTADQKVVTPDQATPDQAQPDMGKPDTKPNYDGTVPVCPYEVDLSKMSRTPCTCGTTLVYDTKVQYPDCVTPKVVKCCPAEGKPKCE